MGNLITYRKSDLQPVHLSNGSMGVLIDILAISASDAATTLWEKQFARWLASHDQNIIGLGIVSFDIEEIAWDIDHFDAQKTFILKIIDMALNEHRWQDLGYHPSLVKKFASKLRELVEAFQKQHILATPFEWWTQTGALELCPKHHIYLHDEGCHICNDQPISP